MEPARARASRDRSTPRRRVAVVLTLGIVVAATACGTRRTHAEMVSAAQTTGASGTSVAPTGGSASGSASGSAGGSANNGSVARAGDGSSSIVAPSIGGASPAGGTAGAGTTPAATAAAACTGSKAPIVIGTVGQQSGLFGQIVGLGPKAVQAWAAMVNARGGIDCHPVEYFIVDDGGDPARHQAAIRDLVENKKVIAFVQMDGPMTADSSVAYLNAHRIPVIGSELAIEMGYYTSPTYFPQGPAGRGLAEAELATAAATGKTRLATISCVEVAVCSKLYDYSAQYASKYGLTQVYRGRVSLVQPDFVAQCQAAKDAGADVFLLGVDGNSAVRVARSCASIQYRPQYVLFYPVLTPNVASEPLLDGAVSLVPGTPWVVPGNTAVQEMNDAIARYAPGIPMSGNIETGWVSAKLFETGVTGHLDNVPTSQNVLDGMSSLKNNDLGGLSQPFTFTNGQPAPRSYCIWSIVIRNGSFASPDNGRRNCATF